MQSRTTMKTWFIPIVACCLVTGCAAVVLVDNMARVDNMVVPAEAREGAAGSPLYGNIAVREVTGGENSGGWIDTRISSAGFEQALEGSLRSAGLLAAGKQAGTHFLIAHINSVVQPFMGGGLKSTVSVSYFLAERKSGKNLYIRTITLPFEVSLFESFSARERAKLSTEGAARENVKRLIGELLAMNPGAT